MRKTVAKILNSYASRRGWLKGSGPWRINPRKQLKRDYNKLPANRRAAFLQELA